MQLYSEEFQRDMLKAGVHLGHQKSKWNPKMRPYLYTVQNNIHIIDIHKTQKCLEDAAKVLKQIAKSGKKILFVATKKQAQAIVKEIAMGLDMPYATERWLGGMITNFVTIRKSIKKMQHIEKLLDDTEVNTLTKKEKLTLERDKNKIGVVLKGISSLNAPPACVFLVDINHEHIALAEARRLGIIVCGMVDTNSDPESIDIPIPSNDDSTKSISLITSYIAEAIKEGLAERAQMFENAKEEEKEAGKTEEHKEKQATAKDASKAGETTRARADVTVESKNMKKKASTTRLSRRTSITLKRDK